MNFCTRCVLPETFPGISFDDKGVCNYCQHEYIIDKEKKQEYIKKFEELLNKTRGIYEYDVLMAYSGGKDSTYTLYQLAHKYKLRVLALTFDNGFISEKSIANILHITDSAGATSMIIRPPFPLMKKIFRISTSNNLYSPKILDRASSICTTCIALVKSIILKTALRMNIPLVAYGWSPGQAPLNSAIMQTNPRLQQITHRTLRDPILQKLGNELKSYFLTDDDMKIPKEKWPINIHPLAFMDYNEKMIIELISSLGWEKPSDTDPNSTNCILNSLANYLHRNEFSFHPYAWEIAGIVRSGSMKREEGIEKTTQEENMDLVRYAAEKLDIKL